MEISPVHVDAHDAKITLVDQPGILGEGAPGADPHVQDAGPSGQSP
jgi:hypothetical protein